MTFDANRLKFGDLIAGGGAVVLFISLFLDWYSVSVKGAGKFGNLGGGNAFDSLGIGPLFLLLVALVVIAIVVMRALGQETPQLPVPLSTVILGLGALAALYVLFRLLVTPSVDGNALVNSDSFDVGRSFGIFLAFLSTLAITAGGFLSARERGEAVPGVGGPIGGGVGGSPLGGGQPAGGPLGGGQPVGGQPVGGQPAGGYAGQPAGGVGAASAGVADPGAQAAGQPKADWYPDPEGKARLRYWDGTQWTDQTAD
jgi:hypothetical protein